MKKIALSTGSRADYFLLAPLMKELRADPVFQLQIIASCMHYSPEYGLTYNQIENDGFVIHEKVEMLLSTETSSGIAKSIGLGVISFADALSRLKPDMLIILGDRFESLAIAQAALVMNIPIAHLHGGELSEGSYDDAIRHSITKMSSLHFASTEIYRRRIIQMGENPNSVFNMGAIGLERLITTKFLSKKEVNSCLNINLDSPYFVICYHPVTKEEENPREAINEILKAVEHFSNYKIFISYPNADNGGSLIIEEIEKFYNENSDVVILSKSLSDDIFLSVIKNCEIFIGNSSSGIIEAPSLGVPSINVGCRQRGRESARSVIHCDVESTKLLKTISYGISKSHKRLAAIKSNPYFKNKSSGKIVDILKSYNMRLSKAFFDISQDLENEI